MSEASSVRPAAVCPFCGGERFTEGEIPTFFDKMQFIKFFPDGRKPAGRPVQARLCDQCGNIQLYVRR